MLGLADAFGASRVPIYCMNVTYPLIPEEITDFCKNKSGPHRRRRPACLHRGRGARGTAPAGRERVKVRGKDVLPLAGEYTGEVVLTGISRFLDRKRVQPIFLKKERRAARRPARGRRGSASAARSARCSRR